MKTIYIKTEKDDEEVIDKLKVEEFAAQFAKDNDVPSTDNVPAKALIEDIVATIAKGETYDYDSEAIKNTYSEDDIKLVEKAFDAVGDIVAASAVNETAFKAAAEKAKADKEAAAKAKKEAEEKAAAELIEKQDKFIAGGVKGVEKADSDFKKSIENVQKALPKGITVVANESETGYGIAVGDGVTEAQIGEAIGYLTRSDENTEYARGAFQSFIGDLANAAVDSGIYKSMIKAGKALADKVKETTGREIAGRSIERFARLSTRCPKELRDVTKPSTLYVRVAEMSSPKREKDDDGKLEPKEQYDKRIAAHEEDRRKLFEAVRDGKVTDKSGNDHPVETVDDVNTLIQQVQIKHKVISPPDPNKKSVGFWLRQFFFAHNAIANLVGAVEKQVAVFADDDGAETIGETKVTKFKKSELTDLLEQAKNALETELYSGRDIDLSHYMAGKRTVKRAKVTDKDGKTVTVKDKDGNVQYEEVEVPALFPNPFAG
jgi:hypothetical protein